MTQAEALEIIAEHLSIRPRKRIGRTVYELRPDGRIDVYTVNRKGTRMVFDYSHKFTAADAMHPEFRAWLQSRGGL